MPSSAIRCSSCGQEAFLVREPVYDGFRKVGEILKCSACGHVYENEEQVPYLDTKPRPDLFTEDDRPGPPPVFSDDDQPRFCRHCRHYVVNPFRQWCGLHNRDVQATDTCPSFSPKGVSP